MKGLVGMKWNLSKKPWECSVDHVQVCMVETWCAMRRMIVLTAIWLSNFGKQVFLKRVVNGYIQVARFRIGPLGPSVFYGDLQMGKDY